MIVHSQKMKQVKAGLYHIMLNSIADIGTYRFALPKDCYTIPNENLVYLHNRKGSFVWQYIPRKSIWKMWQLDSNNTKPLIDVIRSTIIKPYHMIVVRQEGKQVLIMIPTIKNGRNTLYCEWRFFTDFFEDIVRK